MSDSAMEVLGNGAVQEQLQGATCYLGMYARRPVYAQRPLVCRVQVVFEITSTRAEQDNNSRGSQLDSVKAHLAE